MKCDASSPEDLNAPYLELAARSRRSDGSLMHEVFLASLHQFVVSSYATSNPDRDIVELTHGTATYLFDKAGPHQPDRTILASGTPHSPSRPREAAYQRGFPMAERRAGRPLDRGHFMPHTAGGLLGPNLFEQDRALNRGWSREGRGYRALEQKAISTPGALLFVHPIYLDATDSPAHLVLGVLSENDVSVRRFRNRFDIDMAVEPSLEIALAGATDAQIGSLGEETAVVLLEERGATIVSIGDDGESREQGRQQLDMIVILDGALTAFEVKTRFNSARAGRLTRAGNLSRPRMRRPADPSRHRQASQPYLAQRLTDHVDTDDPEYAGIDVVVLAVDLESMLAQLFDVNDDGTRLTPRERPVDCAGAAAEALGRILSHRGCL